MLNKGDWTMIQALLRRGVYQKDIAAKMGVHPRTVRRARKRGGPPSGKRPRARGSKLDPYKPKVDKLLSEGVWNAVVILRVLREAGYDGCHTILKDYIRPKRPLRVARATVRFETAPGRQMQNDWGEVFTEVAGRRRKAYFNTNTLGYSRRFHFWCTDSMDAEHTYEGIIRAFEHVGGVTEEVLVDNQKTAVIKHKIGESVKFNERFYDMACHYGFTPRACRPNRARTKGKDERMVGYIKNNFFQLYRSFESFEHMNQLGEKWLAEVADPRFHGTVKEVVAERFKGEAPSLKPLPQVRYDTSYRERRWVSWDGYIDVRGNRYSVPDELRGKPVTVRIALDGFFTVYDDETKIVEYRLTPVGEGWVTVPGHHERLWTETLNVERRDLAVYEEVGSCSS
jgi:transposase